MGEDEKGEYGDDLQNSHGESLHLPDGATRWTRLCAYHGDWIGVD